MLDNFLLRDPTSPAASRTKAEGKKFPNPTFIPLLWLGKLSVDAKISNIGQHTRNCNCSDRAIVKID